MGWFHAAYAAGELDLDGNGGGGGTCSLPRKKVQVPPCPTTLTGIETIYHMTEKAVWEAAIKEGVAYFPKTFHKDGKFTRASIFKEGLIDVANHFYKDISQGEWICLELNLKYLLDMGIVVLPQPQEESGGNGEEDAKEEKDDSPSPVQCFQIYAGIPTMPELNLVKNIYPMKRGGCGTFLDLEDPKPYGLKPKSKSSSKPKDRDVDGVEKVRAGVEKIPGLGSVPSGTKSSNKSRSEDPSEKTKKKSSSKQPVETPKRSGSFSKEGLGKMFGMKSKK